MSVLEWRWQRSLHWDQTRGDTGKLLLSVKTMSKQGAKTDCSCMRGKCKTQMSQWADGFCRLCPSLTLSCGTLNTCRLRGVCHRTCLWSEVFPGNSSYSAGKCWQCTIHFNVTPVSAFPGSFTRIQSVYFKGTLQPKFKDVFLPSPVVLFIHLAWSGLSCSVRDNSCRDVCPLLTIMDLDGSSLGCSNIALQKSWPCYAR